MATLGKTTVGGTTTTSLTANHKRGSKFVLTEPAVVSSISVYFNPSATVGATQPWKLLAYPVVDGVLDSPVAVSAERTMRQSDAASWYSSTVAAGALQPGTYWLGIHSGATTGGAPGGYVYDTVSGQDTENDDTYTDGPSDPFGTITTTQSRELSIFATYTAVPQTIQKIYWSPPTLTAPTTVHVSGATSVVNCTAGTDYNVIIDSKLTTGLEINLASYGTSNVKVVGGEIQIDSAYSPGHDNCAIYVSGNGAGTIWLEGLWSHGTTLGDWVNGYCPNAKLVRAACRHEKGVGSSAGIHADGFGIWGGCASFLSSRSTIVSQYQGDFFGASSGHVGYVDVRDSNTRKQNEGDVFTFLLWIDNTGQVTGPVKFTNVWVDGGLDSYPNGATRNVKDVVYPNTGAAAPYTAAGSSDTVGNKVSWPSWSLITGEIRQGTPPGGDFCPSGVAGMSYSSPGYDSTDFAGTAALGIYRGSVSSSLVGSPNLFQNYTTWLGAPPSYALDFLAGDVWAAIEGASWQIDPWAGKPYTPVISVPMFPDSLLSTTYPGTDADVAAILTAGASGTYDSHFTTLATVLSAASLTNSVIRIGWEPNGNWYPSRAGPSPAAWVLYFQRIVNKFRAVSRNFKFAWSPAIGDPYTGTPSPEKFYPGDNYVDYLGPDTYDEAFPAIANGSARWTNTLTRTHGLTYYDDMSLAHNKPLALGEWAVALRHDTPEHGGGDDTTFIQNMYDWITARRTRIGFHVYYEYDDTITHMLSNGNKGDSTTFPNSALLFRELFGVVQPPSQAQSTTSYGYNFGAFRDRGQRTGSNVHRHPSAER